MFSRNQKIGGIEMKKTIKGFVLGAIITTLLMSSVFGVAVREKIEVLFNSVDLTVNGEKVAADNILYDGTTYVPLRAVADILGKDVGWNEATRTASINDKDFMDTDSPSSRYVDIKPEEAFDIYMEKYPNTQVKKVELDKEMGEFVYQVEGFDDTMEYEIDIDPSNGDIIKESTDRDDDRDNVAITRADVARVEALVDKALADSGEGAELENWNVEVDDGIVELEVEVDEKGFGSREYKYNVKTGELLKIDD